MIISRIILKNWRNFQAVDVELSDRVFLIGPNASGKSNFLDALRFLRDLAKPGGGLQKAVSDRHGLSKIRCLYARRYPNVEIEIHLSESSDRLPTWKYALGMKQKKGGNNPLRLAYEKVWLNNRIIINRPNGSDIKDDFLLTQTYLEQINSNSKFREIYNFLESILHLHLVPQLLRYLDSFSGQGISENPFGKDFLERITKVPERTRKSRLKKIENALKISVPQFKELSHVKDEMGIPHLEAIYEHWRPNAGKQREDQFSDGTLRLIGLLWSLLEGDSLLLLEEPELSLNSGIVNKLAPLIYRLQGSKKRQLLISTHSADLLSDQGIGGEEVLLLQPGREGTSVELASADTEIRALLEGGLSIADAALPYAVPPEIEQLSKFK